jgi:phage FluMu protein Com
MGIIGMSTADIICEFCNENISEYYHEGYKGMRGKCPKCQVDFPLE